MALDLWQNWPEYIAFILLVIGIFIALAAESAVIAYILIFIAGMMGGRFWFKIRQNLKTPWFIVLIGFLIGFMIGSRYGDNRIIVVTYLLGIAVCYYLHERGIIKSTEY